MTLGAVGRRRWQVESATRTEANSASERRRHDLLARRWLGTYWLDRWILPCLALPAPLNPGPPAPPRAPVRVLPARQARSAAGLDRGGVTMCVTCTASLCVCACARTAGLILAGRPVGLRSSRLQQSNYE